MPDGSVLRARLPGRPTKDCLFSDPARDGVSLLKIWNMNKYTGVLGVYNCQGAAWSTAERKNTFHETKSEAITGLIRGRDVHLIAEAAVDNDWKGDCAVYSHRTGELVTLPYNASMPISLKVLQHEVFTVTPIRILGGRLSFAPIGLVEMYNAGGAIVGLRYEQNAIVRLEVKGCGKFGAYSSAKPKKCRVGSNVVDFEYDSSFGLVILRLDHLPEEGQQVHVVEIELLERN